MPTIRLETLINAEPLHCFDLSISVDIHQGSMAHTKERPVAGVTSRPMRLGDTVTWEAVHFGIRQRLTTKITEYKRPERFVDEMVEGIFKKIRHIHEFYPYRNGTCMIDVFEFEAPLWLLGWLACKLFLTKYMRHLLVLRNEHIKQQAEGVRAGAARPEKARHLRLIE